MYVESLNLKGNFFRTGPNDFVQCRALLFVDFTIRLRCDLLPLWKCLSMAIGWYSAMAETPRSQKVPERVGAEERSRSLRRGNSIAPVSFIHLNEKYKEKDQKIEREREREIL